ncbi:MAG: N-acetylmuramoyl-L-alanine amidase [Armatimonas sp.]
MELVGKTVCIDPGHPSEIGDGTRGKQITELHAAWLVALKLKALLEERGAKVVLTKSSERQMVRNRRRAEIANGYQADLMVRLHCDSESGSGFAIYYPTRQGRAKDGKVGPNAAVLVACRPVAEKFYRGFAATIGRALKNRGLKSDLATLIGGQQGALTGSIYSQVPVVLVEMCVLSNPKDDVWIASNAGQAKMADALAAGIEAAIGE